MKYLFNILLSALFLSIVINCSNSALIKNRDDEKKKDMLEQLEQLKLSKLGMVKTTDTNVISRVFNISKEYLISINEGCYDPVSVLEDDSLMRVELEYSRAQKCNPNLDLVGRGYIIIRKADNNIIQHECNKINRPKGPLIDDLE